MELIVRIYDTHLLKKGQKVQVIANDDAEPEYFIVVNTAFDYNDIPPVGQNVVTGERRIMKADTPEEKFFIVKEDHGAEAVEQPGA